MILIGINISVRSPSFHHVSVGSIALFRLVLPLIFLGLVISPEENRTACAQDFELLASRLESGRSDFEESNDDRPDEVSEEFPLSEAAAPGLARLRQSDANWPDVRQTRDVETQDFLVEDASPDVAPRSANLGMPMGERRSPFSVRSFWMPDQTLKTQPGSLALSGAELELGFPLHIDPQGIWLGLGSVQYVGLETSVVFPDSGLSVPAQFWDVQAGVMHIRNLSDDRKIGGMVRVGSPSDQPFGAWRDLTVTFLGFMTIPSGDRNAWNFSLFYSPTGQIIFPIPGVAYSWRPNDQFQANIGIPFSLDYRPTETVSVSASYMPLNNVQLEVRKALVPGWSVYGGYRTHNETFFLAERVSDQERTYLFDQRLTLGLQYELGKGWSVDLSSAYVFDRKFFQAEKFSGQRRDELLIDSGVATLLQLSWTR